MNDMCKEQLEFYNQNRDKLLKAEFAHVYIYILIIIIIIS